MKVCYVDEAGDGERPDPAAVNVPPVFVICGLVVDSAVLADLTRDFLQVKGRFHPAKAGTHQLDGILREVKGSELRRDVRSGSRRRNRAAIGLLDQTMNLLDRYDIGLVGRVWIKDPTGPSDEKAMYTFSIQDISEHFQHHLVSHASDGLVICDSRTKVQNSGVAHSVFTKMFRQAGDAYPNILEMPVFGHSDNHAGLQLADLVTSGLIFPIAARTYCQGQFTGPHVDPAYDSLKQRFGPRLQRRQIRYQNHGGKWTGGLVVSDPVGHRSGAELFR